MDTRHSHAERVSQQFSPNAKNYLTSAVHAQGADLDRLASLLAAYPHAQVVDLGCGAGHASFTAAKNVARVIAYDLSAEMLAVVEQTAADKALSNIETRQGYAESLPFADASMDVVISRYSAHHWHDVGQALREVRRILKPGGKLIMMDIASPGHPVLDVHLQVVEKLRDTSHVKNYATGEWLQMLNEAGMRTTALNSGKLELEFGSWIARLNTPTHFVTAIRELQKVSSEEVVHYFAIQQDGTFQADTVFIEATRF
ncbi:class I SAM-dependent methyltransferase [Rouxiella chamberiensis]|uniref:Class I SAM-dependent methyltransferase n=1 Tax=Rouxiella chamberiensis TaxID=1513468 RepID=A0ABY7HLP6_9GAMM|nr:class I SAM-dependent methyltransferase [Rouxiella chamberiensis]WAS99993.1 class I SAM-dependent methyltransferase [Rouxiella chamberiensis]